MNASERIKAFFKKESIDRLPIIEWAPWWELTTDNWNNQGLIVKNKDKVSKRQIQLDLGLDACVQTFFYTRSSNTPSAESHGAGIIKSEDDYNRIKKTLYKHPSTYCSVEDIKWLKKTRREGNTVHWFTVEGFFWCPRELFGIERHLYSFYDQTELLHRICTDYAVWLKDVVEYVGNTFDFDFMSFAEDMSYNLGPMLSKDIFDEFLAPYYKAVIPEIKNLKIPVMIDSDGDITKAVDWYSEVGADGMFPLERQAGVDVQLYLEKQPMMFFLGHFDKMVMKYGKHSIIQEFERLLPSIKSKRFLPSVDHQTPPDVSLNIYKEYVEILREYCSRI